MTVSTMTSQKQTDYSFVLTRESRAPYASCILIPIII